MRTMCPRRATVTLAAGLRGTSVIFGSCVATAGLRPWARTAPIRPAGVAASASPAVAVRTVRRRTRRSTSRGPAPLIPVFSCAGSNGLERQGDTLTTPDAQRDHAATHPITAHGMQKTRRQHGAGRANGVTMGDGTAFDIDDVLGQAELLSDGKRYGRERLVDLEALHVAQLPSGTRERLLDCWNRTKAEHAGRNGGDAVGDEARHGLHGPGICESAVGDEHGGGGAVEARRIAGSDGPAFTEGRTQLGETLKRCVGPRRLVRHE